MGQLLPLAPDDYDSTNEQQTRRVLEERIFDLEASLQAFSTTVGTLRMTDGDLTLVNGSNNDLGIGYSTYARISGPTASFTITGMQGGELGRFLILRNTTAYQMTIANQSASSVAANRIVTNTGADVVLLASSGGVAVFEYDATLVRWVLIAIRGATETSAQAIETDYEAATSVVLATSPGRMIYHPGVAKAALGLRVVPTAVTGNISSVDTSTDQITWSTTHGLSTGDVIYSTGGTWPTGITGAATYYARAVSSSIFSLHTSAAGAVANTGRVDITLAGSGTQTMNKLVQTVRWSYNISASNKWINARTDVANQVDLSISFSAGPSNAVFGNLTDNTNFTAYQMQFRNTSGVSGVEMDAYTVTGTTLLWSALSAGANYDFSFVAFGDI